MTDYVALASGHLYSNKTNRILKPADNGRGYQKDGEWFYVQVQWGSIDNV